MRHLIVLNAIALLLCGCVTQGKEVGDAQRIEFPRYDGPKLTVVIKDMKNLAEDARYSELGPICTSVLKTEIGRSNAVNVQGREQTQAILEEWEFSDTGGVSNVESGGGGAASGPVPQRPDVLIWGEVTAFDSGYENAGMNLVFVQRKQYAEASITIRVQNMHTMQVWTNYGKGRTTKATGSGFVGGSSATYDRSLGEEALRAAIYDCWTRLLDQLRSVNPTQPAGE